MVQYNGLNGMVYNLEKKIKSGGEGVTYSVQNNDHLIAKLYKDNVSPEESIRRVEKLRAMVGMGIDPMIDHHLGIAWPIDVLHEPSTGKAVGFVMPMAKGCESLIVAARPSERAGKLYGQEYTFRHSVATAYNLAQVVNVLHNHRMVVGDLNSKNILVNRFGEVTLIDTDSMQIMTDDGTLHKCSPFGMIESKAPELQGRDLRRPDVEFTVYSDRFALAVHIFELLCEGRHPFNLRNPDWGNDSVQGDAQAINISQGYCPYVRPHNMSDLPADAPNVNALLPPYILDLFKRAFGYDAATAVLPSTLQNRPTAAEWEFALKRFYDECIVECANDSGHVFWAGHSRCPWCGGSRRNRRSHSAIELLIVCMLAGVLTTPVLLGCMNAFFGTGFNVNVLMSQCLLFGVISGAVVAACLRNAYRKAAHPENLLWWSLMTPFYAALYFAVIAL